MRPSVLFLGHGADRSGPPVFLANFQRWLASHTDLEFATVLTSGGPLLDDYRSWGPVRVLDNGWTPARIIQQGLARTRGDSSATRIRHARDRVCLRSWRHAPLVYVNTASPATIRALDAISTSATVITHVHELEVALRYQLDPRKRALLLSRTDLFVAASQAVADNLREHHGVDPARIVVHHEFIEPVTPIDRSARAAERRRLGIAPDAFVVGGSGRTEWRKGPDLFVHLARDLMRSTEHPTQLFWVGGATSGPEWWPLDHEAHHLGVQGAVRFVGEQARPGDWYRLLDAFAVTSREDAFPLAALEAASAGVPVVTFDTGGMVELVSAGAGRVVPYPDMEAFSAAVAAFAADEQYRRETGEAAARLVRSRHTTEIGAPRLFATLSALLHS